MSDTFTISPLNSNKNSQANKLTFWLSRKLITHNSDSFHRPTRFKVSKKLFGGCGIVDLSDVNGVAVDAMDGDGDRKRERKK